MASLRVAEQCGLEGVVSKRRDTTLPIGRVAAAALKASADLSGNVRPNSFRVDASTVARCQIDRRVLRGLSETIGRLSTGAPRESRSRVETV